MTAFANIAFTPSVQALQEKNGSRETYARMQRDAGPFTGLGAREAEFIGSADSFYMATVSETGWPYVQHRGGPRGFIRVLSPTQLAFADFRGNRQMISAGNVTRDDRVALIIMDYPNRQRLKLLGHLRFVDLTDAGTGLATAVQLPDYRARAERAAVIELEAFDWNCPQHITPRYTTLEVEAQVAALHDRIAELEGELAAVRGAGAGHPA